MNISFLTTEMVLKLQSHFKVRSLKRDAEEVSSAVYLQVSITSQALIFVTRSRGLSFLDRPGVLLVGAFVVAQLVSFSEFLITRGCDLSDCN